MTRRLLTIPCLYNAPIITATKPQQPDMSAPLVEPLPIGPWDVLIVGTGLKQSILAWCIYSFPSLSTLLDEANMSLNP